MGLGVALENGAFGLACCRKRNVVGRVGSIQNPCDDTVFTLIDGRRRAFAPHRPVDRFDGQLARVGGREGLPTGNFALAGLPGRNRDVQRLLNGLVDDLRLQIEHGAQAGGRGWPEMRDMVDLVGMKTDALYQVDLHLVGRRQSADQIGAGAVQLLGDRQERRDVVAGMGVVGGQESVVKIQFPDGGAVGPRGPFGMDFGRGREAEHRCTAIPRMQQSLGARRRNGSTVDGRHGDAGIVDDAVDNHPGHVRLDLDRIGGERRELPSQLILACEVVCGRMDGDLDVLHEREPPDECR